MMPGSPPRGWSGRACSRSTGPSMTGTVVRSAMVSAAARCTPGWRHTSRRKLSAWSPRCGPRARPMLRAGLAGPLSVAVVAQALGLGQTDPSVVLSWYGAIVDAVSALARDGGAGVSSAGSAAFGMLSSSLRGAIAAHGRSTLLGRGRGRWAGPRDRRGRLERGGADVRRDRDDRGDDHQRGPASAQPSRSAQASSAATPPWCPARSRSRCGWNRPRRSSTGTRTCDIQIGGAAIRRGDLVTVSLAGAGRDPAVFPDPDRFDVRRENARLHLAFARGPHFCLGAHLARLEAQAAVRALLRSLPGLRLDPERPSAPRGLVFRKPPSLHVLWDPGD